MKLEMMEKQSISLDSNKCSHLFQISTKPSTEYLEIMHHETIEGERDARAPLRTVSSNGGSNKKSVHVVSRTMGRFRSDGRNEVQNSRPGVSIALVVWLYQ